MRSLFLFFNCLFISLNSDAQNIQGANWDDVVYGKCDNQNITWWSSDEAIRIAKNVLMYQKESGGWPKNIQMQKTLSQHEKNILIASKQRIVYGNYLILYNKNTYYCMCVGSRIE